MPGRVSAVAFDTTGKKIAAVSSLDGKGEVRIYDVASGKTTTCEGVNRPAYTVAWKPGNAVLASAGFDGIVWLHDALSGKLISKFQAVPKSVATAANASSNNQR